MKVHDIAKQPIYDVIDHAKDRLIAAGSGAATTIAQRKTVHAQGATDSLLNGLYMNAAHKGGSTTSVRHDDIETAARFLRARIQSAGHTPVGLTSADVQELRRTSALGAFAVAAALELNDSATAGIATTLDTALAPFASPGANVRPIAMAAIPACAREGLLRTMRALKFESSGIGAPVNTEGTFEVYRSDMDLRRGEVAAYAVRVYAPGPSGDGWQGVVAVDLAGRNFYFRETPDFGQSPSGV